MMRLVLCTLALAAQTFAIPRLFNSPPDVTGNLRAIGKGVIHDYDAARLGPRADATGLSDLMKTTDNLLFKTPLPAFITTRELAIAALKSPQIATPPTTPAAKLDWDSDGCSSSPDNPFHFPFLPACQRHDFGYRNYQAQHRWVEPNRKILDENLYKDLKGICDQVNEGALGLGLKKKACYNVAKIYFDAVRAFGAGHGPAVEGNIAKAVDQQTKAEVASLE